MKPSPTVAGWIRAFGWVLLALSLLLNAFSTYLSIRTLHSACGPEPPGSNAFFFAAVLLCALVLYTLPAVPTVLLLRRRRDDLVGTFGAVTLAGLTLGAAFLGLLAGVFSHLC